MGSEQADEAFDEAVVIALGSNLPGGLGSSVAVLDAALSAFDGLGLRLSKRSRWWRSAAWPDPTQPDYINGVALVEPSHPPRQMLDRLHTLEAEFGRQRHLRNAPRTLDLDIVAYGRLVVREAGLALPHPRAAERRFVMGPLAELAPTWRHPLLGRTAEALAAAAPVGADAAPL